MSHRRHALVPVWVGLALATLALVPACKKTGTARVAALRDALAEDDASDLTSLGKDTPACVDAPEKGDAPAVIPAPCLAELAKSFGATAGYTEDPPDQAAAGAVVITILRDGRGDRVGHPEAWIASTARGKGSGADALRLAIARTMKGPLEEVATAPAQEKGPRLMKAVATALPGACATYARLGAGGKNEDLPLTLSAEHSPCVHKDLARSFGPGPTYGHGAARAAEGALALWKEYLGALEAGVDAMDPKARKRLEGQLPRLRELTAGIALEKVATPSGNEWASQAAADHADAGMPGPPPPSDAGRDARR